MRYLLCFVVVLGVASAPREKATAKQHIVIGQKGPNRWDYLSQSSPAEAEVNKPAGRLVAKVKPGDTVLFRVEGGTHGVLFEHAKSEMAGKVWEIVPDSGTLSELPENIKNFDREDARTSEKKGPDNNLIEIRIKELKPGADKGILFACNPHSVIKDPNKTKQPMLGVIVLDEGAEKK
jgi:hypothetical protein